jgi:hypothetical protein
MPTPSPCSSAHLAEFGGSRGTTAATVSVFWIGGAVLGGGGYLVSAAGVVITGLAATATGLALGMIAVLPLFMPVGVASIRWGSPGCC